MLQGKTIVLGITGGIAAYKAAELTRMLVREQATVQAVMTTNAQRFVTPLTLQVLSGQPVCTDLFDLQFESQIGHIQIARAAHLVIVAPTTANVLAKLAAGIADDYLTTVLLATTAPVLLCPAMNVHMFHHPATRRNLDTLRELGYHLVEPASGMLACGDEGEGRLADLQDIMEVARRLLTRPTLRGKRILISAGPTWEAFDPVRFVTNPSTGKMGFAIAVVAARRGAEVHLVTGPSVLCAPRDIRVTRVVDAQEMKTAMETLASDVDAIIMAAAVGDYRPEKAAVHKIKKDEEQLEVTLVKNPDILAHLGQTKTARQVLIGFAAETDNLIANATEKLHKKNLDFIVANDLTQRGAGFACDTNQVKILHRDGRSEDLPCLPKEEVAALILDRVESLLGVRT
ncbi:MAG TPA: bifunctional phosphopantothenoylcysteine decarboxylase/phosphopantothenate--cysteine ligase CoaBC [Syntrophobacteraceae bacterium]|nr:bifunctional phosphopantothenoylcysteine decarboxylase/phosphopantothenate--cysteine ligase CoaBC [Syntrophobacteraceae bacterium]